MGIEVSPSARQQARIRRSARTVLGARNVSAVKITRADGSVVYQEPYKLAQARRIVKAATTQKPERR